MEETIYQELNIPRKQIKETSVNNRYIVLTHKTWIKNLLKYKKIVTFPSYKSDISEWPRITDIEINWEFVYLVAYKKHSHKKVIPLQKCKDDIQDNLLPLTYSQLLQHVQQNNHKNLWKLAHKKYTATDTVDGKTTEDSDKWSHKKIPADVNQNLLPYDLVLRECITRMYNCTIIHSKLDRVNLDLSDSNNFLGATTVDYNEPNCNLLSLLAAIESSSHYYLIYNYVENTMLDCLAYSPAILENQFNKNLFIIYQLLDFMKFAHSKGLFLGTEFGLKDILIDKNLRIYILPKLDSNLIQYEESEVQYKEPVNAINIRSVDYQNTLRDYCEMWCTGKLSNFDYLTILNNFAGRKINSPYNHHIIPWVIDFTSRQGNFRDLTKSKYRLNKGDRQLDLTFTTCSTATPHHVSDILSEITYYVYMARKTSKSVLCKHVRSKFVANEYPASIARMYAWSPDECIPEFYTDPTVFKSIHEDLPDLEIPNWSTCPEDFVAKHREALESQYVSENLHHWIDLNFGYKLSGKHAIKAKNVCLSLVDQHKDLCQRGVVQLFQCPHPPKQFKNVWFGKVPPRITSENQKRLTRSSEDLSMENLYSNEARSSTLSTSPRASTSRMPHQSESIERSTSYHISVQKPTNQISLPKNYNPIAQLKAVENMESFLSKTFHEKQSKTHQPRNPSNDPSLLTTSFQNYLSERYETDSENAFTNRMFLETYEASLVKDNKMYRNMKHKNLISQNSKRNFKHLVSENRLKEVQVIGCLIVELFLLSKLRPLIPMDQNFEDRLEACQKMLRHNLNLLPRCIQYPVKLMFGMCSEDEEKIITDKGLPTSSLSNLLLEPIMSNLLLPFPVYYIRLNAAIKIISQFESTSKMLNYYTFFECNGKICKKYDHLERAKMLINRRIAECKLKSFVVMVDDLMGTSGFEQFDAVEVLLPHVLELLHNDETSILAAWYLFDSIATALGIQESRKKLLHPILRLYDIENDQEVGMWNNCGYDSSRGLQTSTSIFRSKKAVKLYHHSFLLKLIVRFGLKCFLDNFIVPLIEAVGGHKDLCQQEQQQHFHGSFFSPKRSLKYKLESTSIEEKASSSHYESLEREEVFKLETDEGHADCDIDQEIDTEQVLMKMLDQFELKSDTSSIDLKLTHSTAEEAKEGPTDTDDMHVNDFMVGDEKIKIYSSSPEKSATREKVQSDPKSPEIPIPSSFRRSIQVNSIGCEIGSRKSTDSFDFLSKTPNESTRTAFEGSDKNNESGKTSKASEKLPKPSRSTRISEMSSESLIWLAHRLGPLLTARYLTRNLLKMLTLCYVSQENLLPNSSEESNICFFTLCDGSVVGDQNSQNVMECLTSISALFGEEFILMQYFPHISELIALTKKKITINLEGGIIGALQLLKCLIPCLSDAIILEHLQDSILTNMINPIIRLLSSSRFVMPSGYLARNVLARKLLDTIYTLSVRIGPDMTMQHICVPALQRFFLIFDKAYGIPECVKDSVTGEQEAQFSFDVSRESVSSGSTDTSTYCEMQKEKDVKATEYKIKKHSIQPTNDPDAYNPVVSMSSRVSSATREKGLEEIRDVFTPSLAHTAYTLFLNQLGDHIMTKTVKNLGLILNLSHEHEIPNYSSFDNKFESTQIQDVPEKTQATDVVDSNSFDSNVAVIGNRIDVQFDNEASNSVNINEIQELVSYKLETFVSNRKLRGNWLAYWQNEIGRSEKDTSFNMQQIKLQQYSGHTNSIRSILCLDNENSFMTASKDKTVKLWSLRNEGDGTKVSTCQYTYNNHRKSVHSLAFLESLRLTVSCDSGVHMWDPFVGTLINQLDSHKYSPVSVVKCYPSPSSLILAGTADSTLKFIDARLCDYVMEWKITTTPSGSVRCLAVSPSRLWVAVGLSSGYVSIIDARSGMMMSSWRASEGELLQLIALNDNELISSSIDQNISIWNISNGSLKIHFRNPPEPVHCIKLFENQMIAATPANRLGAFEFGHELQENPQIAFTKLRSDIFKGILSSFTILPLNRMLLAGSESGQITLLI